MIKALFLLSTLLASTWSFAQDENLNSSDARIEFRGTIEFDSTRSTFASISIVQGSILNTVQSDSAGKYRIITSIDLEKPFFIAFSCMNYLEKKVVINLKDLKLNDPILVVQPARLIEALDIRMIPINPNSNIESITVGRFYWNEYLKLDAGHYQLQTLKIENYLKDFNSTGNTYYPNGQISAFIPIQDGLLHGTIVQYAEDGAKTAEIHVKNGDLHGEFIHFYPNGKVKSKAIYADGEFVQGQSFYYSEDGELIETLPF